MTTSSPVIFRALVDRFDTEAFTRQVGARPEVAKRHYEPLVMTDHGDHVEWTNGERIWRWRLPDQEPVAGSDLPVVTTIAIIAGKGSLKGVGLQSFRVRFLDEHGVVLGRFAPRHQDVISGGILDVILPPETFQGLRDHGVVVVHEDGYRSQKAYLQAHPEPDMNPILRSMVVHVALWATALVVAIVAVAAILAASSS